MKTKKAVTLLAIILVLIGSSTNIFVYGGDAGQTLDEMMIQAKKFGDQGKHSEAIDLYKQVLNQNSEHKEALQGIAVSYDKSNQNSKAIKAYEAYLGKYNQEDVGYTYASLGEVYERMSDQDKANKNFRTAAARLDQKAFITQIPQTKRERYEASGNLWLKLGEAEKAVASYSGAKDASEINTGDRIRYQRLVVSTYKSINAPQVDQAYQELVRIHDEEIDYYGSGNRADEDSRLFFAMHSKAQTLKERGEIEDANRLSRESADKMPLSSHHVFIKYRGVKEGETYTVTDDGYVVDEDRFALFKLNPESIAAFKGKEVGVSRAKEGNFVLKTVEEIRAGKPAGEVVPAQPQKIGSTNYQLSPDGRLLDSRGRTVSIPTGALGYGNLEGFTPSGNTLTKTEEGIKTVVNLEDKTVTTSQQNQPTVTKQLNSGLNKVNKYKYDFGNNIVLEGDKIDTTIVSIDANAQFTTSYTNDKGETVFHNPNSGAKTKIIYSGGFLGFGKSVEVDGLYVDIADSESKAPGSGNRAFKDGDTIVVVKANGERYTVPTKGDAKGVATFGGVAGAPAAPQKEVQPSGTVEAQLPPGPTVTNKQYSEAEAPIKILNDPDQSKEIKWRALQDLETMTDNPVAQAYTSTTEFQTYKSVLQQHRNPPPPDHFEFAENKNIPISAAGNDGTLTGRDLINHYYRENKWDNTAAYEAAARDGINLDDYKSGTANWLNPVSGAKKISQQLPALGSLPALKPKSEFQVAAPSDQPPPPPPAAGELLVAPPPAAFTLPPEASKIEVSDDSYQVGFIAYKKDSWKQQGNMLTATKQVIINGMAYPVGTRIYATPRTDSSFNQHIVLPAETDSTRALIQTQARAEDRITTTLADIAGGAMQETTITDSSGKLLIREDKIGNQLIVTRGELPPVTLIGNYERTEEEGVIIYMPPKESKDGRGIFFDPSIGNYGDITKKGDEQTETGYDPEGNLIGIIEKNTKTDEVTTTTFDKDDGTIELTFSGYDIIGNVRDVRLEEVADEGFTGYHVLGYIDKKGKFDMFNSNGDPFVKDEDVWRRASTLSPEKKEEMEITDEMIAKARDQAKKRIDQMNKHKKEFKENQKKLKNELRLSEFDRRAAEKRRADWAGYIGAALYPTRGALEFERLVESWFGKDISVFGSKDWRQVWGGKLAFIDSDLEGPICDRWFNKEPSSILIEDYPGHYLGGSDLPDMGSVMVVNGLRTEYEAGQWSATNCNFEPKWFPIEQEEEIKPLGYLYKLQWYIKHPYTEDQVRKMNRDERRNKGLDEFEGNITYRVIIKGKECEDYNLPGIYEMPSPNYLNLAPGKEHNTKLAYYGLSYIDTICISFEKWKYNGNDQNYPKDCDKEVKLASLKAPENFGFMPTGTTAVVIPPGEFTPISGSSATSSPTQTNCPPALIGVLC